ncbi:MAG: hypothetical protein Ct9H300mP3_09490 [Gammaproteobacteria bacterium]|nr:MAG: hypothetical protein Ct9H300mP3_09490 [Gammaproteobacteria bacterium]
MKKIFLLFGLLLSNQKAPKRNIHSINIKKKGDLLFIDINANAFLLNMVRIITGTLLETGLKKITPKKSKKF